MIAEEAVGEPDVGAVLADCHERLGQKNAGLCGRKHRQGDADKRRVQKVVAVSNVELEAQANEKGQA